MGCTASAPAKASSRKIISARFVREWRLPADYDASAEGESSADGASPTPLPRTVADADRAREGFWDTCATFGGAELVWGALRQACDGKQFEVSAASARAALAMMLSSCAEDLSECYDERGVKYELPVYVRAYPADGV